MIGILILLALLLMLGVSLSTKSVKLPKWAEFDPNEYWGVSGTPICDWFERHKWLKIKLIKLAQLVIIGTLFIFNFTKTVTKSFIKTTMK